MTDITVSSSVTVAAPAARVFGYLLDPVNQVEWTPNFLVLEQGPDRPAGVGMRYRGRLKAFGSVNFVVDRFEPGRMFRVDTDPRVGRLTHQFTVTPYGGGARISHEVCLQPTRIARAAGPLMRLLIARMIFDLDKQMRRVIDALPAQPLVDDYFAADGTRDIDAVVALFSDDAVVVDERQTWSGREAIREWQHGPASRYRYTTTVASVQRRGDDRYRARGRLDGDFPGGTAQLHWDFTISDGRISRLEISAAT